MAYLNGIFAKKATNKYGEYNLIGIKRDDFIAELEALPVNERGFINVAMSSQKSDSDKFSFTILDGAPAQQQTKAPTTKKPTYAKATKPVETATDDLPF